ncbi:hypothetical protein [Trichothermofontia sp.]
MNITTRTGLVGFFLALSTRQVSGAVAATTSPDTDTPVSRYPPNWWAEALIPID